MKRNKIYWKVWSTKNIKVMDWDIRPFVMRGDELELETNLCEDLWCFTITEKVFTSVLDMKGYG